MTGARASAPAIGIVDPCCPAAYGPGLVPAKALGGTEATVLRVIGALARDFDFHLYQKPCWSRARLDRATLHPLEHAFSPGPARAFLVINSWKVACRLRRMHPDHPISLWLHVHPGRHNRAMGQALDAANINVICVSESHARSLGHFLSGRLHTRIGWIHNPVADALQPDDTPRDRDRLLFASSPHKGLAEVFERFRELRGHLPGLKLCVADPGYLAWQCGSVPDGVRFLGRLDHPRLMDQMRRALCLFYPQTTFAETFGLVLAEANAVGTPVLAHRGLGANDEVVRGSRQLVDAGDPAAILARIGEWRAEFPQVRMHSKFRQSHVATEWLAMLDDMTVQPVLKAAE